ncbi:MAG: 4Fe-4S binding protein [Paracoccaceae bacterium]|nr:4Fe-4S binding protein [Paracoccaceae bacterium]
MAKNLVLCDCLGSQEIDRAGLETVTGLRCSPVFKSLCTTQTKQAAAALEAGDAIICCGQEQRIFESLAAELDLPQPGLLDLRDRAGWSGDTTSKLPKMAALAAEAVLTAPQAKSMDVTSEGLCLILGATDVALAAASDLAEMLSVTVLLSDLEAQPEDRSYDVVHGRLKTALGSLGQFEIRIDALQQRQPGGRGQPKLTPPRDGSRTHCDILLDLTGGAPLFPAHEKRDGYLRADPSSPPAVFKAILEASQMVGTFEKPLYVKSEPLLCAHSRAEQIGCAKCLGVCPTGAITPDGDHVTIDSMICAGCGACAAVCPSGSISYDMPPVEVVFQRMQTLAQTYRSAGGAAPRLLVHDSDHGRKMIALAARYEKGLPSDVVPIEISALTGFGHAEMLVALACGFTEVALLLAPHADQDVLRREYELAEAVAGSTRLKLLDLNDPSALCEVLFSEQITAPTAAQILPMGTRRQVTRLAAKTLQPEASTLALPEAAPYGAILVNTDACTLCLSCVSLCPSGALGDNPDLPQLLFQEDACLQCGLCANICPEKAITLKPRLNLEDSALSQVVLHEEEPCACVECGALFGVKSTIDKIIEKLAGKHSMFATSDAARMIQMCDNCRVNAQFHSEDNPFTGAKRPRVRTSDDYYSDRKDH